MKKSTLTSLGLLSLFCLTTLSACGQLSKDQWRQLEQADSQKQAQTPASEIANLQVDSRGSVDVQYRVEYDAPSQAYHFSVTRALGTTVSKTVSLGTADSPTLYPLLQGLFSGKITLQSRVQCTDCNGWNTLTVNRKDASVQMYNYPVLQNTNLSQPLDQLNQFVLNRL